MSKPTLSDRVKETTQVFGTGDATLLGAVTGFRTFISTIGANVPTYYCISNQETGEWEVGKGTVLTGPTRLAREVVYSSSNNNVLVNFGLGVKDIFINYPASRAVTLDYDSNNVSVGAVTIPGVFDIKAFGAVNDAIYNPVTQIWSGTDNTIAIQAAIDSASSHNGGITGSGTVYIPQGAYFTNTVYLKNTRCDIRGEGKMSSTLAFNTGSGCLVATKLLSGGSSHVYGQHVMTDFGINGGPNSGVGIDFGDIQSVMWNCKFENLNIISGQQMFRGPSSSLFSSKLDTVAGMSYKNHGIQCDVGPSVSLINLWASTMGSGKACYRLTGTIRMSQCNGTDYGDYWLIAGNDLAKTSGYSGDFPTYSYSDIVLDSCNIESWGRTGPTPTLAEATASMSSSAIYVLEGIQQLKILGGTFVRTVTSSYHSIIRCRQQFLDSGAAIELEGVRFLVTGSTPTAGYVYSDTQTKLHLKNVYGNNTLNGTGSLQMVNAGVSVTYPPATSDFGGDLFADVAHKFNAVWPRRLSVDMMRFNFNTVSGSTSIDVTGKTLIKTANTASVIIDHFTYDPSVTIDQGRNGFLFVNVEDTFTTFKHLSSTVNNGLRLLGNRDYVAQKGDVLVFMYSGFYNGVNAGWTQVAGGRGGSSIVFNVREFGAKGDGITNDYTAIQTVVNIAASAGGGTIQFSSGSYVIANAVNYSSGSNLIFKGEPGSLVIPTVNTQRAFTQGAGVCKNITFDNIKISGSYALGLVFGSGSGYRVKDCDIQGATGVDASAGGWSGGIFCIQGDDIIIERCNLYNNGVPLAISASAIGFDIQCGGSGFITTNAIIRNNRCTSTDAANNIGGFDVSNITITGNYTSGARCGLNTSSLIPDRAGYGIMVYQTGNAAYALHNIIISDNRIRATKGTGIYLQGLFRGLCANNEIEDIASVQDDISLVVAGISVASCTMVTVTGNTITKSGKAGISVSDFEGSNYGVVISGNSIDQTGNRPAIYLRGTLNHLEIGANNISNMQNIGIGMFDNGVLMTTSSQLNIHNNIIVGTNVLGTGSLSITSGSGIFSLPQLGILSNGNKIKIQGNVYTLSSFDGTGRSASLSPTITSLIGSRFTIPSASISASANGMNLLSISYSNIEGNIIDNVGGYGLAMAIGIGGGYSVHNNVKGNIITDAVNGGIYLTNATNYIVEGNHSVSGPLGQQPMGITVSGTGSVVRNNNVRSCTNTATELVFSGPVIVEGNITSFVSASIQDVTPRTRATNTIAYSASMTPNVLLGDPIRIAASTGASVTINAPINLLPGQRFSIFVKNTSGGALGTITWDAIYKMATFTSPANGFSRSIQFYYDGVNCVEESRTPLDVPN